jgi:hypothetical protein
MKLKTIVEIKGNKNWCTLYEQQNNDQAIEQYGSKAPWKSLNKQTGYPDGKFIAHFETEEEKSKILIKGDGKVYATSTKEIKVNEFINAKFSGSG